MYMYNNKNYMYKLPKGRKERHFTIYCDTSLVWTILKRDVSVVFIATLHAPRLRYTAYRTVRPPACHYSNGTYGSHAVHKDGEEREREI